MLACHGGIADGFADCDGDGGIKTKDFLADTVEKRHGFEIAPGDRVVTRRDMLPNLRPQTLLDVGVEGEKVAGPGECAGGRLMLFTLAE
jgi:hypothetical protein